MGSEDDGRRAALEELADRVRACTRCRLSTGRLRAVPGEGSLGAAVVLIGEAPGREEDASGRPFVGAAGKVLDAALAASGLARSAVFLTNAVKCRPPNNRAPKADEREACHPYLAAEIELVRPKVLVTLGATGLRSLLGPGEDLKSHRGKALRIHGVAVVPTYHPAAVLYNRRLEAHLRRDLTKAARLARLATGRVRSAPPRAGVPSRSTVSSGGVLVSPEGRILLLRRTDEATWGLPKGSVEEGESLEATAIREIEEETGLRVKLLRPLRTIRYEFFWPPSGVNFDKTVAFFLAEPVGGRLRLEAGFDEARWVLRGEAMRLLYWKNDRDVVASAFDVLDAAPPTGGTRAPARGARRSGRRRR